jgi:pSer/pThr/pTyr-binding forkhead associated (FHA) protein
MSWRELDGVGLFHFIKRLFMDVKLIVEKGGKRGQVVQFSDREAILGRAKGCTIRIPSAEVSRRHCRLVFLSGSLYVEDLTSANGTYLDGREVTGVEYVASGSRLSVGPVRFRVEYTRATPSHEPPRKQTPQGAGPIELPRFAEELFAEEVDDLEVVDPVFAEEVDEPALAEEVEEPRPRKPVHYEPLELPKFAEELFAEEVEEEPPTAAMDAEPLDLPVPVKLREILLELEEDADAAEADSKKITRKRKGPS